MLSAKEKFIVLTDNDMLVKADAIILLEGDGFSRLAHCAKLFHNKLAPVICFSGGSENKPYGSFNFEMYEDKLIDFNLNKTDFIIENKSQHTQEQAIEVIKLSRERNWKKIILVASHFHQYRAYLTFLKIIEDFGYELVIINSSASDLPWFETQPWGQRFQLLNSEFEKIEKYMELRHCATYEEAIDYQVWKEEWILAK